MRELRDILSAFEALRRAGESGVLATVVHVEGSTYRRPGARMLVLPDARMIGLISGGCLEADLLEHAERVRGSGVPEVVHYDSTSEDDIVWGLGLGCAGVVDVLLQRVSAAAPGPLEFLGQCLRERRAGLLATVVASEGGDAPPLGSHRVLEDAGPEGTGFDDAGLAEVVDAEAKRARDSGRSRMARYERAGLRARVLVEVIRPPTALVVFGAGPDAAPLVRMARELGWRVTVVDGRPAYARAELFPEADAVALCDPEQARERIPIDGETVAIVMTHHYLHDRALLGWLLASPAPYVGALGPRRRTEDLLRELRESGLEASKEKLGRLHGPAGLDLGGDAPEEIALSVLAEMQAALTARSGRPLRECPGPIHDPTP